MEALGVCPCRLKTRPMIMRGCNSPCPVPIQQIMFPLQAASFAGQVPTKAGREIASFEGKHGASCTGMTISGSMLQCPTVKSRFKIMQVMPVVHSILLTCPRVTFGQCACGQHGV